MAPTTDIDEFSFITPKPNTQLLHARQPTSQGASASLEEDQHEDSVEQVSSLSGDEDLQTSVELGDAASATTLCRSTPSIDDCFPQPSQFQPQNRLKRKFSEDLTNFADEQARCQGLFGADADKVTKQFAHYTLDQKLIVLFAGLKHYRVDIDHVIKASSGPWVPPNSLVNKIRKFTYLILVDPAIPAYGGSLPAELVLSLLVKYPHGGYSTDVSKDDVKQAVVKKLISDQLTVVRNEFKSTIHKFTKPEGTESPKDLNSLCHAIIAQKLRVPSKVKLTINMAARFAFLRCLYLMYPKHNFWPKVDKSLDYMRNKYDDNGFSACFRSTLDDELLYTSYSIDEYIEVGIGGA
ncbi:hypothetical protein AGABI2DRAFT_143069 [Agaricus bisporus var. bisporus H97]|uniref:hypothetical protein n=1 Tax=Agaricus bisporus var. bisporus (strain H97 / ATCC MYA-4626 / FGSC 10389) TaxID=936046 RepID=UPI00029F7018|nr:hypothetical protein AGABI2DRAFT_143069 [Agaricus bisporus var. bisporus H97]EKV47368.1 hypothetical protein AGABI2DRAFT_143069 [Agaricus bisporus var. bisporus H97]